VSIHLSCPPLPEQKSLGMEFGGVVGILLFLSNNFGVAMYVLGFVEALQV
jgi:amino acid transporter